MKREELEALRASVNCEVLLEREGWKFDIRESTRRAVKYRRDAAVIIVTHGGRGWFDPLSNAKGDVFALAMRLDRLGFSAAVEDVASCVGFRLSRRQWRRSRPSIAIQSLEERWRGRSLPGPGSRSWQYLRSVRCLPSPIIRSAIRQGVLREGPFGSMWAAHTDIAGHVTGWEERGPDWRGFATGGSKVMFRIGAGRPNRLCVTEAAIDAMSLAAIEGMRDGTLYVSTGGGWSPATENALVALAERQGLQLVAATDANSQGEVYADRLRAIASSADCDWQRLRPPAEDWNEVLKKKIELKEKIGAR